jgi:hypothetical protein
MVAVEGQQWRVGLGDGGEAGARGVVVPQWQLALRGWE